MALNSPLTDARVSEGGENTAQSHPFLCLSDLPPSIPPLFFFFEEK